MGPSVHTVLCQLIIWSGRREREKRNGDEREMTRIASVVPKNKESLRVIVQMQYTGFVGGGTARYGETEDLTSPVAH